MEVEVWNKVLVIGNSITYSPPDPQIGWNADWGMAASARENDFVSVLTDSLYGLNPVVQVFRENVYPFERHFDELSFETYEHLKNFEPDLLIIRLGENADIEKFDENNFSESLMDFAAYLSVENKTKVIITTTFWDNELVNDQLNKAALQSGWEMVPISHLGNDVQYKALGEFEHEGVANHPGDKGMKEIADLIFAAIKSLK